MIISNHCCILTPYHRIITCMGIYDRSESDIQSLKSNGMETSSYGAMLYSVLLTKLPPEIRLISRRETLTWLSFWKPSKRSQPTHQMPSSQKSRMRETTFVSISSTCSRLSQLLLLRAVTFIDWLYCCN